MLSINAIAYLSLVTAIVGSPLLAAIIYERATRGPKLNLGMLTLSGFMLALWLPLVIIAPTIVREITQQAHAI